MHFCTLVFTKEFPTDAVLSTVMKPYYEGDYYKKEEEDESTPRPLFLWDYFLVGGRYGGLIKLNIAVDPDVKPEDDKYGARWSKRELRAGRLFRSECLETLEQRQPQGWRRNDTEDSALSYMGSRDGFLYVDGALCADILNLDEIRGFYCIDADGNAYSRENWDGEHWNKNEDYEAQVAEVMARSADCFLTIIDCHD